jgi:hypothetical protein
MVTVTKKHQTSMALVAVVLATVMIAGTFAMGNNAFATKGHFGNHFSSSDGKSAAADQRISETCDQNQNSPVTTSGAISPPIASGINLGACLNLNLGGNALNQDQSTQN